VVLGQTMARGKWQSGFAWKWAEGFRAKPQGGEEGNRRYTQFVWLCNYGGRRLGMVLGFYLRTYYDATLLLLLPLLLFIRFGLILPCLCYPDVHPFPLCMAVHVSQEKKNSSL